MNNNQINLPENLLEEYIKSVNKTASSFGDLCNEMQAMVFALRELLRPVVNELYNYVQYVYPSGRVKHLALFSRSARVRNKNLSRILKSYQKFKKRGGK